MNRFRDHALAKQILSVALMDPPAEKHQESKVGEDSQSVCPKKVGFTAFDVAWLASCRISAE